MARLSMQSERVSKRMVQASTETREGMVRIPDGLRPGEHVVLSPESLAEGKRVNPTQVTP